MVLSGKIHVERHETTLIIKVNNQLLNLFNFQTPSWSFGVQAFFYLFDVEFSSERKDVVVDGHVDSEKFEVGAHVTVKFSDLSSKVENVDWSVFFKDLKNF